MAARTSRFFDGTFWKALLFIALIILFVVFVSHQKVELTNLVATMASVNPVLLLMGLGITAVGVLFQGAFYRASFRIIGKRLPLFEAIRLYLMRYFLSTFIPAGFTVSQFTFANELEGHRINRAESHLASAFYLITGAVSYLFVLVPAMAMLMVSGDLSRAEWYAGWIVTVLTLLVVFLFTQLLRRRGIIFFIAKHWIPDLPQLLHTLEEDKIDRTHVFQTFWFSLSTNLINIALLALVLATLHLPFSLSVALVGYAIMQLVLICSPIFQGVGLVEISLVYVLNRLGINNETAIAATLLYRLFQLWIPFIVGGLLVWRHRVHPRIQEVVSTTFPIL